jgi:hypothetical protein
MGPPFLPLRLTASGDKLGESCMNFCGELMFTNRPRYCSRDRERERERGCRSRVDMEGNLESGEWEGRDR